MDGHSFMKELIENPGQCHIVRNISSFLDAKSLGQCRLVCQSWRDLIDNDRPWLVFQLEHIHTQERAFFDREDKDKPTVKATIKERFSEWYNFIQETSRKQNIPRLKEFVRQMWTYLGDDQVCDDNPLHYAISKSNCEYVKLLIDCGIDLTMTAQNNGRTPMHYACLNGSIEMVKLLIKQLATFDASSRNDLYQTIYHLAVCNPDPQVPKLILDTFRYEDFRDNDEWTMIHTAVLHGPKETIQFLLESRQKIGLNLEARTNKGSTILHLACWKRDIEIVDIVSNGLQEISSDIDFDTLDNSGESPLHDACLNKDSDVAIHLLKRFPQRLNVLDGDGWHVLHFTCRNGHLTLLNYLIGNPDLNIDFNVVTQHGNTPLHIACWKGQIEIVKVLLENSKEIGIDIAKKNNYQQTAEDVAKHFGYQEILDLFEIHRELEVCFWNTIISLVTPMSSSHLYLLEL